MNSQITVRKDSYLDSVLLMRISRELKQLPGIEDAVVAMGTPQNKSLLADSGYASADLERAGPNDLVIAVRATEKAQQTIEQTIAELLRPEQAGAETEQRPRSVAAGLTVAPDANLAVISVPGLYAAREAHRALRHGLHVLLFSDNVSVEDEIALKTYAVSRGLLMMGPDCGTAIINGKPLAFANVVRPGPIGIVGASGTGIQEVTCCIDSIGGGITQAIGTGGRDLSDKVKGLMTLMAIRMLATDPDTTVLVVISKPPSPAVASTVVAALVEARKPAVVHFVGSSERPEQLAGTNVEFADSLAGTAEAACRLAGVSAIKSVTQQPSPQTVRQYAAALPPGASLRGLFCGGTTGQEALALLDQHGLRVYSNLRKSGAWRTEGTGCVTGNVLLDLGADEFTVGRPHPMIDPVLRNERLQVEMQDPQVGILLFDCVLGYGSHPDPAGVLAQGFAAALATATARGTPLLGIASITGTAQDPQRLDVQKQRLVEAGLTLMDNNYQAATLAALVMKELAAHESEAGTQ